VDLDLILEELSKAPLHVLYRIRILIDQFMDNPQKIHEVRRRLYTGKEIEYYHDVEDRMIPAKILRIKRTRVFVQDLEGGRKWDLPFYLIKMDETGKIPNDYSNGKRNYNQDHFKVGSKVAFRDSQNTERYGEIIRLNQKTATITVDDNEKWRVAYSLLSPVIETCD
jgi:hypothetical protein